MLRDILPISLRATGLRNEAAVIKILRSYDLAAIRAPTLLITARDDGYGTYANAQYTAARIRNAKFIGYEMGGHLLVGHDDTMRDAIAGFLAVAATP